MGTEPRVDRNAVGKAGLSGWRTTLAESVAGPVSRRTPMSRDDVRAVVGALFLALSLVYVAGAVRRVIRDS